MSAHVARHRRAPVLLRLWWRIDHLAYRLHGRATLPDLTFVRLAALRDAVVLSGDRELPQPRRGGGR